MIECIETLYLPAERQGPNGWEAVPAAERWLVEHNRRQEDGRRLGLAPHPIATPTEPDSRTIAAFIDASRWIGECPDCHHATLLSVTDPRFICTNHKCVGTGSGEWFPVVLPEPIEATRIELALCLRRNPAHRGWKPGEGVSDLMRENAEHGEDMSPARVEKIRRRLADRWRALWGVEAAEVAL